MSTEFFIARRYLLAKRKGLFAMITTFIGVAGVALGQVDWSRIFKEPESF